MPKKSHTFIFKSCWSRREGDRIQKRDGERSSSEFLMLTCSSVITHVWRQKVWARELESLSSLSVCLCNTLITSLSGQKHLITLSGFLLLGLFAFAMSSACFERYLYFYVFACTNVSSWTSPSFGHKVLCQRSKLLFTVLKYFEGIASRAAVG